MISFLDLPLEIRERVYHYLFNTKYNNINGRVNWGGSTHAYMLNQQIRAEAERVFYWENPNVLIKTNAPLETLLKHGPPLPSRSPALDANTASKMPCTLLCTLKWPDTARPMVYYLVPSLLMKDFMKPFLMAHFHQVDFSDMSLEWSWLDPLTREVSSRTPARVQRELLSHFILFRPVALPDRKGEDKLVYDMVKERHGAKLHPHFDQLAQAVQMKLRGNELYAATQYLEAVTQGYSECLNFSAPAVTDIQNRMLEIKRTKNADDYEYITWEVGTMAAMQVVHQSIGNSAMCWLKLEIYDMVEQCCMQAISKIRHRKGLPMHTTSHPDLEVDLRNPAEKELGKIYYRMALAAKAQDDMTETRALLKIAQAYLPRDKLIAQELQSSAPRLR